MQQEKKSATQIKLRPRPPKDENIQLSHSFCINSPQVSGRKSATSTPSFHFVFSKKKITHTQPANGCTATGVVHTKMCARVLTDDCLKHPETVLGDCSHSSLYIWNESLFFTQTSVSYPPTTIKSLSIFQNDGVNQMFVVSLLS